MDTAPLIFKVRGLDCAEEVVLIKSVLLPLGVQENDLSFDLLNGKLMLGCAEPVITSDPRWNVRPCVLHQPRVGHRH